MAHCVDIESIYQLLEDGKRTWNVYLSDAIGHKPAQIFHTLVLKFRSYNANKSKYSADIQNMLNDGWFYCTIDDLYDSTRYKYKSQATAIKKLIELELIEVKTGGLFNKRYFRIIANGLQNILQKSKDIAKKAKQIVEDILGINTEKRDDSVSTEPNCNESTPAELNDKIDSETYPEVYDMLRENFKDSAIKSYIKLALRRGVNKADVYDFISRVYARIEGRNIPKNNLRQYLYKSLQNEPLEDPTFYIPRFSQPKKKEHYYDDVEEEILAQYLAQFKDEDE